MASKLPTPDAAAAAEAFDEEVKRTPSNRHNDIRRARASELRRNGSKETPQTAVGSRFQQVDDFVRSEWFESIIGLGIFLNCGSMGIEINEMVVEQAVWLVQAAAVCEHLFTVFFLLEFFLRVTFLGYQIYIPGCSPAGKLDACSNLFDAGLVWVTGVFIGWLMPLFGMQAGNLRILQMLRAFRLFRLVRIVRTQPAFSEVYMLIRGLVDSLRTLFWTVLIIGLITYLFAIFGVVLISVDVKEAYDDYVGSHPAGDNSGELDVLSMLVEFTDGVFAWMHTLIQIITLDSWNAFGRPLMIYSRFSWILIYAYIAVAFIVFMNLVTAVIVENALKHSKEDEVKLLAFKDAEQQKQWKMFQYLFLMMDTDKSGYLTIEEFENAFLMEEVAVKLRLLNFKEDDIQLLFDLLDEGDGNLSLEEFLYGLQSMKGPAQAKNVFMSRKKIEHIWSLLRQSGKEASDDVETLFQSIGKPGAKKKRKGTLEQRAKQTAELARQKSPLGHGLKSPLSPVSPSFSGVGSQGEEQLEKSLKELRDRIDIMNTNVQSQVENMSKRLDEVEARNASAADGVRLLAHMHRGPAAVARTSSASAFAPAMLPPAPIKISST